MKYYQSNQMKIRLTTTYFKEETDLNVDQTLIDPFSPT